MCNSDSDHRPQNGHHNHNGYNGHNGYSGNRTYGHLPDHKIYTYNNLAYRFKHGNVPVYNSNDHIKNTCLYQHNHRGHGW